VGGGFVGDVAVKETAHGDKHGLGWRAERRYKSAHALIPLARATARTADPM